MRATERRVAAASSLELTLLRCRSSPQYAFSKLALTSKLDTRWGMANFRPRHRTSNFQLSLKLTIKMQTNFLGHKCIHSNNITRFVCMTSCKQTGRSTNMKLSNQEQQPSHKGKMIEIKETNRKKNDRCKSGVIHVIFPLFMRKEAFLPIRPCIFYIYGLIMTCLKN